MKLISIAAILFAAVSMASPVPEADADQTLETRDGVLEARGKCAAGCSCLDGRCNCASCNIMGCNWYYNGQTC